MNFTSGLVIFSLVISCLVFESEAKKYNDLIILGGGGGGHKGYGGGWGMTGKFDITSEEEFSRMLPNG